MTAKYDEYVKLEKAQSIKTDMYDIYEMKDEST